VHEVFVPYLFHRIFIGFFIFLALKLCTFNELYDKVRYIVSLCHLHVQIGRFLTNYPSEERVGDPMYITLDDGTCQPIYNPVINFTGFENLLTYSVSIPVGAGVLRSNDIPITRGDEFFLMVPLNDSSC
jgi:hypothetical protein